MATLIYCNDGWGYQTADGFVGWFDSRAEAVGDLERNGYWFN